MRLPLLIGFFVAMTAALGSVLACGNTTFENGSTDAGDRSDAAIANDASTNVSCPSGQGPSMVRVGDAGDSAFCIDSTEVTNGQYQAFLAAIKADYVPVDAGAQCAWNTAYTPSTTDDCAKAGSGTQLPVTCIDWCDAYSFCAWAGKHLCGPTASSTPLDIAGSVDSSRSEWELACSGKGTSNFPYGQTYKATTCNAPGVAIANVGSFAGCVGGYPGIFDMAGNAAEWVDACEAGGNPRAEHDNCAELGDSYSNPHQDDPPGQCAKSNYYSRSSTNLDVGFRCCAN